MKNKVKVAIFCALLIIIVVGLWSKISPTKILFVNFRSWQVASKIEANDNYFIKIYHEDIRDGKVVNFQKYDMVILFGMGLHLTEPQKQAIAEAKDVKFYVYASSSRDSDLANLTGDHLKFIAQYMENANETNTREMLNYIRREIHGKEWATHDILEAREIPGNVFFHINPQKWFSTVEEFEAYYQQKGFYKANAPKVMIQTSNMGVQNSAAPYIALIKALENEGCNVYAATGFFNRLENIRKVQPDILIYFAHGRLAMGKPDSALALLKELNIPLISPLLVHEKIDEWQVRQQGMMGGMLSQSIVAPEIDGATVPYVLGGLKTNADGYDVFAPIPERVDRFAKLIKHQLALKNKPNSEKKLAIIYYKGPGKNAMVAGGMEVAPSLLNLLNHLRDKGYNTGELPETADELMALIQSKGNVFGHYAEGAMKQFIEHSSVPLIKTTDLEQWMENCLNENLIANVKAQYGDCPGNYLVLQDSVENKLALPSLQFGNILLMPQLMPALEGDEVTNIHGAKTAPPYSYIATYLYAREGFKADALVHFGTHGSLEFTPWKQTALSSNDWPDALIGDMPHFYLYTIGNIGEAIIAKRRGNAALVSHLTPPFQRSGLGKEMRKLHAIIHSLDKNQQTALIQKKYAVIRDLAMTIGLDKDLDLPQLQNGEITTEMVEKMHHYLHRIESEKIIEGLYTLGNSYSLEQCKKTVETMFAEELGYNLAKLDILDGKFGKERLENSHFMAEYYFAPATNYIEKALNENHYPELLSPSQKNQYEVIKSSGNYDKPQNMMAMMMAMASSKNSKEESGISEEELEQYVIAISADNARKEKFLKLKKDEKFQRMSALLDEESLNKARKMSKIIKPMKEGIEFFESEGVAELIDYMNQSDKNRQQVFQLLQNKKLAGKIEKRKQQNIERQLTKLNSSTYREANEVLKDKSQLEIFLATNNLKKVRQLQAIAREFETLPPDIRQHEKLQLQLAGTIPWARIEKRITVLETKEADYVKAVETISATVDLIKTTVSNLQNSSEIEMNSLVNALNCGFIPPSSGGDAVNNPYAVPTGRNLYGIDAKTTPGEIAWEAGKELVDKMLAARLQKDGKYPRKIAFTLWGGEFIRDQGLTIAQILYLLGVEPVSNSMGRVYDVHLIPLEELERPRIDVFVQTSGQFRDMAASRLFLIDKAVQLASADKSAVHQNYVKSASVAAEKVLKDKGFSPLEAQEFSTSRIFGGTNGNYGTGIMGTIEAGDTYDSDTTIANQYIKNMGAIYTENHWGETRPGLFEAGAQHTDVIMHARSSNTHGPLSLDHVYEFMGGLNTAITKVTGKEADGFFVDYRNKYKPEVVGAKEAIWTEARSTILNKNFLEPLTKGGASSAEVMAEYTRNTFGWNATKESVIDEQLWDNYHEVLIRDSMNLGMKEFFEKQNPYALQEVTAVMLESVRKEFWHPSEKVVRELVDLHVALVNEHDAGCSGFVCNNAKLRTMIEQKATVQSREKYHQKINQTLNAETISSEKSITLEREKISEKIKNMARENYLVIAVLAVVLIIFVIPLFRKRKDY